MGASCRIVRSQRGIDARVVGFTGRHTLVMPLGSPAGICKGDRVIFTSAQQSLAVGRAMLGRMIDGAGRPIDGKGQIACEVRAPLWPAPIGPMQRRGITDPLATGIRAIDALMTVGMGQRMGIFSGSGVGKSRFIRGHDSTVHPLMHGDGALEAAVGKCGLRRTPAWPRRA